MQRLESLIRLTVSAAAGIILSCCGNITDSDRLERISRTVDHDPRAAIEALDSIDAATLPEKDRHYHDFLSIKARDKAYVEHTSDSLILDVMDYYHSHHQELYPEALYYGGRVYSDLGDLSTAIRYFQNALEILPDKDQYLHLRSNITSQTGRLLNRLRMNDEAIPYLEETLRINRATKDTTNLMYNLELLGGIHLHREDYTRAKTLMDSAYTIARNDNDKALIETYLAAIMHHTGHSDSALALIRNVPKRTRNDELNFALSYASEIYLKAGIIDTAAMYAKALIGSTYQLNKITGYYILLQPDMFGFIDSDSIYTYYNQYRIVLENRYNANSALNTVLQNTMFNYALHERNSARLTQEKHRMQNAVTVSIVIVLVLLLIFVSQRYHYSKKVITLQNQIRKTEALLQKNTESIISEYPKSVNDLRKQLAENLSQLESKKCTKPSFPAYVLKTDCYIKLKQHIEKKNPISWKSPLWDEIESCVLEFSQDFKNKLQQYSTQEINEDDYRLALLIKLGIPPLQISALLCKAPGTISYRRKRLMKAILPDEKDIDKLDDIIQSL